MRTGRMLFSTVVMCAAVGAVAAQDAPAPTPQDRIAALKASLAQSAQAMRQYEWRETTAVSLKGEEKSKKENRCYYSADGQLQKVPTAAPPEPDQKRGLRGKIVENKKEEMGDYMKSAVALVKSYLPPDPARIQAAKDAGKVSVNILDPGKRARIDIRDYEKAGDTLSIEINLTTNQLLGMKVASYLTDAADAVSLDVKMASLPDGTVYQDAIMLDGKAKEIKVAIKNSGHHKVAG